MLRPQKAPVACVSATRLFSKGEADRKYVYKVMFNPFKAIFTDHHRVIKIE